MTDHILHENNEASLDMLREKEVTVNCFLCKLGRGIIRLGETYGEPPKYRQAILSCGHAIELELTPSGIDVAAPYRSSSISPVSPELISQAGATERGTMKHTKQEIQEAQDRLRELLRPGDKVYTILRHVSRSGMSRHISVKILSDGRIGDISHLVATALDDRLADDGGIVVGGCGMDMGWHLIYNLSSALWPQGFTCPGDKLCHANDHSNGDRDYTAHLHNDGGYALRQEWL